VAQPNTGCSCQQGGPERLRQTSRARIARTIPAKRSAQPQAGINGDPLAPRFWAETYQIGRGSQVQVLLVAAQHPEIPARTSKRGLPRTLLKLPGSRTKVIGQRRNELGTEGSSSAASRDKRAVDHAERCLRGRPRFKAAPHPHQAGESAIVGLDSGFLTTFTGFSVYLFGNRIIHDPPPHHRANLQTKLKKRRRAPACCWGVYDLPIPRSCGWPVRA